MKIIFFLLIIALSKGYSQTNFITKWRFTNPTSQLRFYAQTAGGAVNYTWITSPSNQSGSGSFTQSAAGLVTLTGLNIAANDTLIFSLQPQNLRRFFNADNFGIKSADCQRLIDVSQWGSVSWSSMRHAFYGCINLHISATDIPDLSNVTDMSGMFRECASLNHPNLVNWNVSNVTNMSHMFADAINFNQPIENWNVSNVTNMNGMFSETGVFTFSNYAFNQPLNNWNVGNVTNMRALFSGAKNFNRPLNNWNVSKVTDMSLMFERASSFNQPIGNWNVNRVKNMSSMFEKATSFNQPIANWVVDSVTNMSKMFKDATSFNQPIGNWNVLNVVNMSEMFYGASSFQQNIANWNVSNVTNMMGMFRKATSFNQPIGNWNVSNVTNMSDMFNYAESFNQPINNWNVGSVTNMSYMFYSATSFNQPIGNWNVSNVNNMSFMFFEAGAFNQSLGSWTLKNGVNMNFFFNSSGVDCANYSATLIGWASNSNTPNNITLDATDRQYGATAISARNVLIGKGWVIQNDVFSNICLPTTVWSGNLWNNGAPNNTMHAIIRNYYNTFLHGNITAKVLSVDVSDTLFVANNTTVSVLDTIFNDGKILSCGGTISGSVVGNAISSASFPIITTQPTNQIVYESNPYAFSVVASGGNLNYQWKQGVHQVGGNSPSYSVTSASISDNGKKFSVIVSNFCGSVLSDSALLTVQAVITSSSKEDFLQTLPMSYSVGKIIYTEISCPAEILVYNTAGLLIGKGEQVLVSTPGIYVVKIISSKNIRTIRVNIK
ncbi:MAG: BspA family leucine-rich repeat surface protein [Cytophagales bacterium]|nr:BspA family leucine-rich repeat surface protein [Cytophagales bacterium]MDW8383376.1 BspA family leucine-rich repeat surface protein [Flammeovirgaceae bacterium]